MKAILIHSCINDTGHYYSFIKDIDDNILLKYNDEKVFKYDKDKVIYQSFGFNDKNDLNNQKMLI